MLSPCWLDALERMFRRRQNRLYMPMVLLSVIHLLDQNAAQGPVVRFLEVESVFDQLGGAALQGKAWQPLFHLSRSMGLWTLYLGDEKASFDDLAEGRPKSRGSLLRRADRAVIHSAYCPALFSPSHRRLIAWNILRRLLLDDTPLPQHLARLSGLPIGRDYQHRPAPQFLAASYTRTYDTGPIQRASHQHHSLQDELAHLLLQHHLQPLEPRSCDPAFDLAWRDGERLSVVEVKSLGPDNESAQLRSGLGQVLEYRHLLARRTVHQPRAMLAVDRPPRRLHWTGVCGDVGVALLWPGRLDAIFDGAASCRG